MGRAKSGRPRRRTPLHEGEPSSTNTFTAPPTRTPLPPGPERRSPFRSAVHLCGAAFTLAEQRLLRGGGFGSAVRHDAGTSRPEPTVKRSPDTVGDLGGSVEVLPGPADNLKPRVPNSILADLLPKRFVSRGLPGSKSPVVLARAIEFADGAELLPSEITDSHEIVRRPDDSVLHDGHRQPCVRDQDTAPGFTDTFRPGIGKQHHPTRPSHAGPARCPVHRDHEFLGTDQTPPESGVGGRHPLLERAGARDVHHRPGDGGDPVAAQQYPFVVVDGRPASVQERAAMTRRPGRIRHLDCLRRLPNKIDSMLAGCREMAQHSIFGHMWQFGIDLQQMPLGGCERRQFGRLQVGAGADEGLLVPGHPALDVVGVESLGKCLLASDQTRPSGFGLDSTGSVGIRGGVVKHAFSVAPAPGRDQIGSGNVHENRSCGQYSGSVEGRRSECAAPPR